MKTKKISTLRLEACLLDAREELKEIKDLIHPKTFFGKLNNFFRFRDILKIMIINIRIDHTKRQIDIMTGKYDKVIRNNGRNID